MESLNFKYQCCFLIPTDIYDYIYHVILIIYIFIFLSAPVDCELFEDRFFLNFSHPVARIIPGMNLSRQHVFNLSFPCERLFNPNDWIEYINSVEQNSHEKLAMKQSIQQIGCSLVYNYCNNYQHYEIIVYSKLNPRKSLFLLNIESNVAVWEQNFGEPCYCLQDLSCQPYPHILIIFKPYVQNLVIIHSSL